VPQHIKQLGRYEISRHTAETSSLSVYDAYDPEEKRSVSLGILRAAGSTASGLRRMDHPGWIAVLRPEEDSGGVPFLIMEPFDGKPLEEAVPLGRKLAFGEVVKILRQLAGALDHAHSCGLIHGSLNPAEILANDRGEVKILGLELEERPEYLLHAVHYLSPERLRSTPMDGRSDQFSLAVLAHRLLTGHLPFPGDSAVGVMFRIVFHAIEPSAMRALPADAQLVLERALDRDGQERYSSCGEMVEALEAALNKRTAAPPTRVLESPFANPLVTGVSMPPKILVSDSRHGVFLAEERPGVTWFNKHRKSLKLFGAVFGVCVALLSTVAYIALSTHPKPAVKQTPAPVRAVVPKDSLPQLPKETRPPPALPPTGRTERRRAAKPAPVKEPEVILKPLEPKVGHQ